MKTSRKLIVIDFDSTLINEEGLDILAGLCSKRVANRITKLTEAAMRGEIRFEESLEKRVAALRGTPVEKVLEAASALTLTRGADELVNELHAAGHVVGAISGGFGEMVQPIATGLGLDFYEANTLGVSEGHLTGTISGRIINTESKAEIMLKRATALGIPVGHTVAVGDGANDVAMIQMAGLGIAFMAKPPAAKVADHSVIVRDLGAVLKLIIKHCQ